MSILHNAERFQKEVLKKRAKDRKSKLPIALPPVDDFNYNNESDYMALDHVLPNFRFGQHFYSKARYGIFVTAGCRRVVLDQATMQPPDPDDQTWDPVDWDLLLDDFIYWRKRYRLQGFDNTRLDNFA